MSTKKHENPVKIKLPKIKWWKWCSPHNSWTVRDKNISGSPTNKIVGRGLDRMVTQSSIKISPSVVADTDSLPDHASKDQPKILKPRTAQVWGDTNCSIINIQTSYSSTGSFDRLKLSVDGLISNNLTCGISIFDTHSMSFLYCLININILLNCRYSLL